MKVSIVGSGNVASWLAFTLNKNGICVKTLYGRTRSTAVSAASLCGAVPVTMPSDLDPDCDLYLFSLKDDAYPEVLASIPFQMPCAVHTSGSLPQSLLEGYAHYYGVIYPFQTISKSVDFAGLKVPLCIEGKDEASLKMIGSIASLLSSQVCELNGEQRAVLHIAAVFASNFSNALYDIAYQLLATAGISWEVMQPLLQQTIDKTALMTPQEAQTGPAVRKDMTIMNKHLQRLSSEEWKQIYRMLSDYIMKR